MKRILNIALSFLFLVIVFSCSDEQTQGLKGYSLEDIINNSQPITLSDIGAEVKTIKLKLPDGNILSQPARIVISSSSIFIQTRKPLQVYRFDRDGNYLNKISMQGKAKNEYTSVGSIFINPDGNLCVQDRDKVLTYNPEGKFLDVVEMKQKEDKNAPLKGSSPREMYMDKKGNIYESFMVFLGHELNDLIVINPNRDTLVASLNPIRYDWSGSVSILRDLRTVYSIGDEVAYQQQFRDTVFTVDANTSSLVPRFYFKNSNPFVIEDFNDKFSASKERVYVDDVVEDNKYIYARISVKGESQLYLIEKKSGESFKAEFGLNHPDDDELAFYPTWESNDEFVFYYDVTENPEPTIMLMEKL